ncbi:MAG: hypothetical protein H8E69_01085 [Actinobacteria bacterium]|nr:hypothetical protein [Actinomycetota bacterium]
MNATSAPLLRQAVIANPGYRSTGRQCAISSPRNGIENGRLHLIDLDNLHCGPYPSERMIELVRSDYEQIGFSMGDLLFAACNHTPGIRPSCEQNRTFKLRKYWPRCSMRLAQGPDGADLELLAFAETFLGNGNVASRFEDVVVASGDHIFAPAARRFREAGLTVHSVVSMEQNLSRELRREINGCIWLLPAGICIKHG